MTTRRTVPRRLFGGLLLVTAVAVAMSTWLSAPARGSADATFSWAMADRFGLDADNDGMVDYPTNDEVTSDAFLNPSTWSVIVDACDAPAVEGRNDVTFEWSLDGAADDSSPTTQCRTTLDAPSLGAHTAALTVRDSTGAVVATHSTAMNLVDHLIVSIGDSVASGEGVADKVEIAPNAGVAGPVDWSLTAFEATWQEEPCHRSALAGPAQAARRLEQRDPHSSVTFVHLACSGAEMTQGLLDFYAGVKPVGDNFYAPQVFVLSQIQAKRNVDAVTLSIGANDLHFADIVELCLYTADCHTAAIAGKKNAQQLYDERIGLLPGRYADLANGFSEAGIAADKVFITEYFNPAFRAVPTGTDDGYCDGHSDEEREANRDLNNAVVDGLSKSEFVWADTTMMAGLNGAVSTAATAHGWNFVGGIADAFKGHGYCAHDRWVRTIFESLIYQGDLKGPFHPNVDGHLRAYGTSIESSLATKFGITAPALDIEADAANSILSGGAGWLGVLDGFDVDEELAAFEPWGVVHDKTRQFIRHALSMAATIQSDIEYLSALPGQTLQRFDYALDDLDENGDRERDYVLGDGTVIDVEGSITPHLPSPTYNLVLKLTIRPPSGVSELDLARFGLEGTQPVSAHPEIVLELPLRIDTGILQEEPASIRALVHPDRPVGKVRTSTAVDIGGTSIVVGGDQPPLATTIGLFEAKVTGTAEGMIEFGAPFADPDGDGFLTKAEWDAADAVDDLGSLIGTPRCTAGHATIDLRASTNVPGLRTLGTITLDDNDGCDGFALPTIDLVDDDDIGVRDVLDALHRLYRSLRSAHRAKDPDLPLVDKRTSDVVDPAKPLDDFFRKQNLVDRTGDKLTYDPATRKDLDTLPELLDKMAREFRQKDRRLGLAWDPATRHLSFRIGGSWDGAPQSTTYGFDTDSLLIDKGLVDLTGTVSGTVDPLLKLDLGVVIDLTDGDLAGIDRLFLDTTGTEVSLDANLAADVEISGSLGAATVSVTDGSTGAVPILQRSDPLHPMLAVDLAPKPDPTTGQVAGPLLPLSSILQSEFTTDVRLRAQVPPTKVTAKAMAGTVELVRGDCMVAWREVNDPARFASGCDVAFMDNVRPLAGVHDPVAFVRMVLGAFRSAVEAAEGGLSDDQLAEPLPVAGAPVNGFTTFLRDVRTGIDEILATDVSQTLAELETSAEAKLGDALGVPKSRQPSLLTIGYTPAQRERRSTTVIPPALTVAVDLGVCSAGRDADNNGDRDNDGVTDTRCTYRLPTATAPFSLRLGLADGAPVLAGLTTEGSATLNFDGHARLAFGLELPTVAIGGDGKVAFTGAVQPFVHRSTGFELGVAADAKGTFSAMVGGVTVSAGTRTNPVRGCVRARTSFSAPTGNQRVYAAAMGAYVDELAAAGTSSLAETVANYQSSCTYSGLDVSRPPTQPSGEPQGLARAPVYITIGSNTEHLGTATFAAPKVLEPSGWAANDGGVPARLADVGRFKWRVLHEGLTRVLDMVEEQMRDPRTQRSVPLIGDDLDGGADIVESINTNLVDPLGPFAAELDTLSYTDTLESRLEGKLNEWLGPTGANILVSSGAVSASADLVLLCADTSGALLPCPAGTPTEEVDRAELLLPFGQSATASTTQAVDIGFPGLRLNVPATTLAGGANTMSTTIGWNFDLKVGIDRLEGFYVSTAAVKDTAGNDLPELRLEARAYLPEELEANIAFIPITLTDLDPGNETTGAAAVEQADAWAGVSLDFTGGFQNRLPVDQLTSVTTENIDFAVGACVGIQSDFATKERLGTNDTGLPVIATTLKITGGYDCPTGRVLGAENTELNIVFENVELDLGSWVTEFLKPVAVEVNKALEPIRPAIEAVQQPIPGVAEAAGLAQLPAPTWLDAFRAYAELQNTADSGEDFVSRVVQMIDILVLVNDASQQVASGQNLTVPIGTFTIRVDEAGNTSATADNLLGGRSGTSEDLMDALLALGNQPGKEPIKKLHAALTTSEEFFTFPAFDDPTQLFLLLLGKDPTLVQFNGGVAHAEAVVELKYPIGPAMVGIEGRAALDARFVIGFDTYGIREALKNMTDGDTSNDGVLDTAAALLQGLYIEDKTGPTDDPNEVELEAGIAVVASVGVPGLSVDAVGGVYADLYANLKSSYERMRYPEMYERLRTTNNPLCLFDAGGKVTADIRLRFTNPVETWEEVIARKVLVDTPNVTQFCNKVLLSPADNPIGSLATVDGANVLTIKTQADKPNFIRVGSIDGGGVYPTTYVQGPFGTYKWLNTDIRKVIINGGSADDDIVIVGPPTSGFQEPAFFYLEVNGNGGHDRLQTAKNLFSVTFNGGDGNDFLASNGPTTFTGGFGDDKALLECNCSGTINGGEGDDHFTIASHVGPDLFGGNGWDTVDYAYYDRLYSGDLVIDLTSVDSGAPQGFERIIASPFDDTITGTVGSEWIEGGAGNDTITGFAGDDYLDGGSGNDTITGGAGADQLYGSGGNDVLTGNDGADMVYGGDGDDVIDNLLGGSSADAGDYYSGNAGRDTIDYRNTWGPALQRGATIRMDNEWNDGSFAENDRVAPDFEVVYGSNAGGVIVTSAASETIIAPPNATTTVNAGSGNDTIEGTGTLAGGFGNDVITAFGPSTIRGDAGNDTLTGSDGDDILEGGTGNDRLDAKKGNDQLWGKRAPTYGTGPSIQPIDFETTDNDVLLGGEGADLLQGGPGADDIDPGVDFIPIDSGLLPSIDITDLSSETKDIKLHFGATDNGTTDDWDPVLGRGDRYFQEGRYMLVKTGSGNDDLRGYARFWAGPGDDVIDSTSEMVGGPGADTFTGWGRASYQDRTANQPVTVRTKNGLADDGDPTIDRSADGSRLDEVLTYSVVGGAGNDTLIGDADNNVLDGGEGYDTLVGNGGVDTVTYASMTRGVTVRIGTSESEDLVSGDIEHFFGSDHDDLFDASNSSVGVQIEAGRGNDTIIGSPHDDVLAGEIGDDVIDGRGGADDMYGTYIGAGGGPVGYDTVSYASHTQGVYVELDGWIAAPEPENGVYSIDANGNRVSVEGDSLTDFDNATGGLGNDILTGHSGVNILDGGPGDDHLVAHAGDDTLIGGPGRDRLAGGWGVDTFDDAAGDYTIVDFTDVFEVKSQGVVVDFVGLDGYPGELEQLPPDTDEIIGSGANDILTAPATRGVTLRGGAGVDTITGGPFADFLDPGIDPDNLDDADVLDGLGGVDTLDFSAAPVTKYGVCIDLLPSARKAEEQGKHRISDHYRTCADADPGLYLTMGDNVALTNVEALRGTPYHDILLGGDGPDEIDALAGDDYIDGRPGDDVQTGGPGIDVHFEGRAANGADTFVAGPNGGDPSMASQDVVDYRLRPMGSVQVTLDGLANDGAEGEGDNVPSSMFATEAESVITLAVHADVPTIAGSARTDIPIEVVNESSFEGTDVVLEIYIPTDARLIEPFIPVRDVLGVPDVACRRDAEDPALLSCPIGELGAGERLHGTLSLDLELGQQGVVLFALPYPEARETVQPLELLLDVWPSFTLDLLEGTDNEGAGKLVGVIRSSDPDKAQPGSGVVYVNVVGGSATGGDNTSGVDDYDDGFREFGYGTEAEFEINVFNDATEEGTETIELLVEDPDAGFAPTPFTIELDDDDVPNVWVLPYEEGAERIVGAEAEVPDPDKPGYIEFRICADRVVGNAELVVVGGTAAAGRDIALISPVYIDDTGPDQCRDARIAVYADDLVEGTEFAEIQVQAAGWILNDFRFNVFIDDLDDDGSTPPKTVSYAQPEAYVSDDRRSGRLVTQ